MWRRFFFFFKSACVKTDRRRRAARVDNRRRGAAGLNQQKRNVKKIQTPSDLQPTNTETEKTYSIVQLQCYQHFLFLD